MRWWVLAVSLGSTLVSAPALATDAVQRAILDLEECTSAEDAVCQSALARLTNWGDESVGPLTAAFELLPPTGRFFAVTALGRIDSPGSTKALVTIATSSTPTLRALALSAVAARPGPAVQKVLVLALSAPEIPLRVAGAEGLGRGTEGRDLAAVVRMLAKASSDSSEVVAVAAVQSLGLLGDIRGVPAVLGALASPRLSLRRAAVFSARMLPDPRLVDPLIELLRATDRVLADDAARALQHVTQVELGNDYTLWKAWWKENRPKR